MIYPISRNRLLRESSFIQEHAPRHGTWRGKLLWIEDVAWAQLLRGEDPTGPNGEAPPRPPAPPPPGPVDPLPRDQWPRIVRNLAKRAIATDTGAGDTLERLLGKTGKAFKRVFKKITGRGCGCDDRQLWLNQRFPYSQIESSAEI